MSKEFLIVGAGFAGAVCARQLADAGHRAFVVDVRPHVGGNAYDCLDANGVLIHPYGPHIFHTNSQKIFDWLSRFTQWRPYEHRVLSKLDQQLVPFPINRTTIERLYGLSLDESGMREWMSARRVPIGTIVTSEDLVLSSVGAELGARLFAGYTQKQWGMPLSALKASVAARIPVRFNTDDRYFEDTHQFMPAAGYTAMFNNIFDHPNISIELGVDYFREPELRKRRPLIYTGRLDTFFESRLGVLPYRSLVFEHQHMPGVERFQESATVNYPGDEPYTRITEFKQITGQIHSGTSICKEYSSAQGDPYYPIPTAENDALFRQYDELARAQADVIFVGRLAQYRYYNMDQVVAAALKSMEVVCGSSA
jgi:UDP-galactopyranose mutase